MEALARQAAGRGAAIAVFPELCLTGYLPPDEVRQLAVPLDSEGIGRLRRAAANAGIALAFGFPERGPGARLHDSMAFVDARGEIAAVYRKVHLFGSESAWAEAGTAFAAFDAGPFRAGLLICYDTRFPEAARALAAAGAAAALTAAAWLGPADEWELAVRARAMDNGMFVAAAALQGAGLHGGSLIADPHGRVLARAAEGREELITAPVDPAEIDAFRARVPLLKDRRPAAYGPAGKGGAAR